MLLDVGEGTSSQLFMACGGDVMRFDRALCDLRLVWVSHHHADHICGLPMLLQVSISKLCVYIVMCV